RPDGLADQPAPVVLGHDLDAGREAGRELGDPRLHRADGPLRVLARAHHHDAADDLALTVDVGDAAPDVRAEADRRHVADGDRRAALGLQHDLADVGLAAQVAPAAHDVLALAELEQ